MKLIPLKEKYDLTEQDISKLATFIVDGNTLREIAFYFQGRLTIEQIFPLAGVISQEMFSMSLAELSPELIQERRAMSNDLHDEWAVKKVSQRVLAIIKGVQDDLNLYEMEKLLQRRA